jgi:hypothetical protein
MKFKGSRKKRGAALLASFIVMSLLAVAAVSYIDRCTQTIRESVRATHEVQTTHLCDSGVQTVLREIWRPFKVEQTFDDMDAMFTGSSPTKPKGSVTGLLGTDGRFASAVISYQNIDAYGRIVRVRSVGWVDSDQDGNLDDGETRKIVDVNTLVELKRSAVFDYTYFVNNYGWMKGFDENDLIINGDIRANGNFDFTGGSPTVNGSIFAANNSKLEGSPSGLINSAPVKYTNSRYASITQLVADIPIVGDLLTDDDADFGIGQPGRMRQPYDPAKHGAIGSAEFEKWRDYVFFEGGQISGDHSFGTVLGDSTGKYSWSRTSEGSAPTKGLIDSEPTSEIVMPDLSDLTRYQTLSSTYVDPKQTYLDGTANPNYGKGAYIEVWNSSTLKYDRVTTTGNYSGSLVLIGTKSKPIKIHGPNTISQDVVIKGYIDGQGTIYSGRNVHVVGSIRYTKAPRFKGNDPAKVEKLVEKADFLGLAARASVIMGNPTTFTSSYPLQYMTPPFTKGRYDEDGTWVPAFDATKTDSTGRKRYQSTISDTQMNSIAEGVNQIDAVMYTNFVGGGNVGTGGGGVTVNGTIISKDESIVVWSLPMRMNYDTRIRERKATKNPLIDLMLPRSPSLLRQTWQEHGLYRTSASSTSTAASKNKATNGGMNGGSNFGL